MKRCHSKVFNIQFNIHLGPLTASTDKLMIKRKILGSMDTYVETLQMKNKFQTNDKSTTQTPVNQSPSSIKKRPFTAAAKRRITTRQSIIWRDPNLIQINTQQLDQIINNVEKRLKSAKEPLEKKKAWEKNQNQNLVINKFERIQDNWQSQAEFFSHQVKRKPEETLISQSDNFRKIVEEKQGLDLATPLYKKYGSKAWGMQLRVSESQEHMYEKVDRFYGVGNPFNGLFLKVQDRRDQEMEVIRRPFSAYNTPSHKYLKTNSSQADLKASSYNYIKEQPRGSQVIEQLEHGEEVNDLKIIGKNKLQLEKELTTLMSGKRKFMKLNIEQEPTDDQIGF